ncbi:MAG TPA: redoxin domain-containing protein [Terriglobales bacterium]|jgi:peroxiredoxin|nr:redoxin domain-containing protein [Terriglobales bacterium]
MPALTVGQSAPEFELPALVGGVKQKFRLRDYRGKQNVVIAFHPLNWTPV